jgi:hypothetical protein
MSRDISKILKNQRKRRLLKENENDPKLNFVLSFLLKEEVEDYLEKAKQDLEKVKQNLEYDLKILREKIELVKQIKQPKDGYIPVKNKDYFDGKDADENNIIKNVLSKIKIPKDGKDADEIKIVNKILSKIKIPKDGKDGNNGSSDKPEEIADKLNTLEEKVEIKVIKGLKNYFDNINRKIQDVKSSKGGGMGNVEHKTFSVGSTTTSSDIGSKVAASGNAIWVYYNGQFLVKGTHYTISGTIINWLETFSDNTFVDITYIRS